MSIDECFANADIIWSKNPKPVSTFALPVPSISTETTISVSADLRDNVPDVRFLLVEILELFFLSVTLFSFCSFCFL